MFIGAQLENKDLTTLPFRTDGCPVDLNSTTNFLQESPDSPSSQSGFWLFKISVMLTSFIAVVIVCLVGSIVSYFTGGYTSHDERLFAPFLRRIKK